MPQGDSVLDHLIVSVVIGRNEGDRLNDCFRSLKAAKLAAVYADSGSTDDSLQVAGAAGVPVVRLDPVRPFSAGRGRNEGLEEALRRWPEAEFAMFIDGDCTLEPSFPAAAVGAFRERPDLAIVTGHLAERNPDRSIYNRICAVEWRSPAGPITSMNALGGIMAVRISAFRAIGGFHLDAIAGEEPDLGARLISSGYSILKLDVPMATHDANILRFVQWWGRAVRGGHALAFRFSRHGQGELRDGRREILSDLVWGLALPVAAVGLAWPTKGASLLLLASYGYLFLRVVRNYRRHGLSDADARLVGRFIVYSKFAHVVGILKFVRNKMRGEYRIMEYK